MSTEKTIDEALLEIKTEERPRAVSYEATRIEQAQKILGLALILKSKGMDIFFDFSPHVNNISIRCYFETWSKGKEADMQFDIGLDKKSTDIELDMCIDFLTKKLGKGK